MDCGYGSKFNKMRLGDSFLMGSELGLNFLIVANSFRIKLIFLIYYIWLGKKGKSGRQKGAYIGS